MLIAPIYEQDTVGKLLVFDGEKLVNEIDYVALNAVEEKVYLDYIDDFTSDWVS